MLSKIKDGLPSGQPTYEQQDLSVESGKFAVVEDSHPKLAPPFKAAIWVKLIGDCVVS